MRVLVTGAGGQLGRELVAHLGKLSEARRRQPVEVVAAERSLLDVSRRDQVLGVITELEPDLVLHAAAFTAVDACQSEPERAYSVNALGTRFVAEAAELVGAHVVYISTDYVFDGTSERPYVEWDAPNPLSVYGRSKLGGEREVGPSASIVRTSWVIGASGSNIARTVLRLGRESAGELYFVDDQRGSPTVASDLAAKVVALGLERRRGIFHVTNQGSTSWYGLARAIFEAAGLDAERVVAIKTPELDPPRPAPRPANSVLDNAALRLSGESLLPPWEESLTRLVAELS